MKRKLSLLLSLVAASALAAPVFGQVYEMRTYTATPGNLDNLHARFRDHTVKIFEKHGMTNVGYWVPKSNESNQLIYLLSYPDKDARDKAWAAFRKDEVWKKAYAESTKDGKLVAKVDSVFLKPTEYSPKPKIEKQDPARLFELRVYTTNPGKLKDLNRRFETATVELFEKHGLQNVVYLTLLPGQEGADTKLIYFLAHKDEESRSAGFKAFSQDPKWQKARKKSEENGKILIKGGVESTLLEPTDYSPMR
ncbi:MAG: NIPSNAP family protein [Verrucomicrobiales bacterium]|nr:NIPSNAP family protein [Verrucomicrobiales bacterium]